MSKTTTDDLIRKEIEEFNKFFWQWCFDNNINIHSDKIEPLEAKLTSCLQKIKDEAKREAIEKIESLFPHSMAIDMGDRAEAVRTFPEQTYCRMTNCEENRVIDLILNSLKEGE